MSKHCVLIDISHLGLSQLPSIFPVLGKSRALLIFISQFHSHLHFHSGYSLLATSEVLKSRNPSTAHLESDTPVTSQAEISSQQETSSSHTLASEPGEVLIPQRVQALGTILEVTRTMPQSSSSPLAQLVPGTFERCPDTLLFTTIDRQGADTSAFFPHFLPNTNGACDIQDYEGTRSQRAMNGQPMESSLQSMLPS